jgi:Rrf2 family protein
LHDFVPTFNTQIELKMQLTRYSEYAMRAMAHLASAPAGETVHISEIAKEWDVPENILRQLIPKLVKAGFITTIRGRAGGIKLNRASSLISVLDIIESIEGEVQINNCLTPAPCTRVGLCSMQSVWQEAQDALLAVLRNKKLSEIADNETIDRTITIDR